MCLSYRVVNLDTFEISPPTTKYLYHKEYGEYAQQDDLSEFIALLESCDYVVGHNLKFDLGYLRAARIKWSATTWCTMIGEYVLARGTHMPLSLEATAIRRKTSLKKGEEAHKLFLSGIGYEIMPINIVTEYIEADVQACAEIFIQQWQEFHDPEKTRKLINIIKLMNDMLDFILEIEHNGISIDLDMLSKIKADYQAEQESITKRLEEIAASVMGDTPIKLTSNDDMSTLIYSRRVIDKKLHKETFNIGTDIRGRPLYPPRMTNVQFANAVRTTTKRVEKTEAHHCPTCDGKGYVYKTKKDGEAYKRPTQCASCDGRGFILVSTGEIAGFKLMPSGPRDAAAHGFTISADDLDRLIDQAKRKDNLLAVEFLTKKKRLNAINTYLNSFVMGIEFWTRDDGLIHPNFNQTVTKTARLSSNDPNFQNQPKGRKFAVRKTIRSRWHDIGGRILEIDYAGLEFCVAGELSRDKQIIHDILNNKDVHAQTAVIINEIPKEEVGKYHFKGEHKDLRNDAKPYTFAPLYGGTGANEPPHVQKYFQEFFVIYSGHEEWQLLQMDNVVKFGYIATPSGREYTFPGTRRLRGKRTTNATNIVNYPVQGFATGDIVPLACVRSLRRFRELGLRSCLILTVHDSIVVDVYPGELERVKEALEWAMTEIPSEIKERWDYDMVLPLRVEASAGPNWADMETLH